MTFTCVHCKSEFNKKPSLVKNHNKPFCSNSCYLAYRKEHNTILVKCSNCDIEITKSKSQCRSDTHFCSRSCSNSYHNKMKPKRKPKERTCSCGNTFTPKIKSSRTLCNDCQDKRMTSAKYKALTLKEYHEKESVKGKHPSWKNSHIRRFNRSWNKNMTTLPCANCGYDKHVELAHIKDVSSFDDNTTLGEINSPDNVIQLCPNCHWEFDNNIISLTQIHTS